MLHDGRRPMDAIGTRYAAIRPEIRRPAGAPLTARIHALGAALCCLALSGCTFGAWMLESAVVPYNEAVARVDEEQLLLNMVRLRYNDNPMRIDVSSIAAQYEAAAQAEARPFFGTPNPAGDVFQTFTRILPDVLGSVANRPTFSLTPLDDPETIRGLFTPMAVDGIVFLAETSYPLATVFDLFVESMNGVPNAPTASGPPRQIVPEFREFKRAAEILQQLKISETCTSSAKKRSPSTAVIWTSRASRRPPWWMRPRTASSTRDNRTRPGC
jgi:hypothetical protein